MKISRIHKNLDRPLRNSFYISGCYGDIIWAMAVIRAMGGGSLFIGPDLSGVCGQPYAPPRAVAMRQEAWFIKPLAESQPYIPRCDFAWKKPQECIDLNLFRRNFLSKESMQVNQTEEMLRIFGQSVDMAKLAWVHLPVLGDPWTRTGRVLINKTPRFGDGGRFNWRQLLYRFGKECFFVGLDEEHREFDREVGEIERYPIFNALDAAQALAHCELFVGNPSFMQALAQGAKVTQFNPIPPGDVRAKFDGPHMVDPFEFEFPEVATVKEKGQIVHVYSSYAHRDRDAKARFEAAKRTWEDSLYRHGVLAVPVTKTKRDSREIGDDRAVPFLKEILLAGMDACESDESLVIFTNDDTLLEKGVLEAVANHCGNYGACCSFRYQKDSTGRKYKKAFKDGGRDLFAFKKKWLKNHLRNFPDYYLGATDWDYFLPAYMRHILKEPMIEGTLSEECDKVEIPMGYVSHEWHDAFWCRSENMYSNPTQLHNIGLTRKYFEIFRWPLKC